MFPSHDLSYRFVEDFDYVLSTISKFSKSDGRLKNMWLFLNTRKWASGFQRPTQKLGLEFPNVWAMEGFFVQGIVYRKQVEFSQHSNSTDCRKGQ
jgi:hypothetical protein